MIISGKKILVIIIMVVLISSVVAGAASFFNKPQTSSNNNNNNNNNAFLNARLNQVVDFCMRSLPNGTSACDNQLLPVLNEICGQDGAKAMIDACTDGKVLQYYKARNIESNKTAR
jgi:Na+-transporting NADH:ubiquinone oxidoreductase subunit NqrC